MKLKEMLFGGPFKVQVVHAMPGRFRVHVPAMRMMPKEWRADEALCRLIERLRGVMAVSMSAETANVVIAYDANITSQDRIISALVEMLKLAYRHREQFSKFTPDDKAKVFKQFAALMDKHISF